MGFHFLILSSKWDSTFSFCQELGKSLFLTVKYYGYSIKAKSGYKYIAKNIKDKYLVGVANDKLTAFDKDVETRNQAKKRMEEKEKSK